jgi:hypothetical protein
VLHGVRMYDVRIVDCLIDVDWSTVSGADHVESAIGAIRGVGAINAMKLSSEARVIEIAWLDREE